MKKFRNAGNSLYRRGKKWYTVPVKAFIGRECGSELFTVLRVGSDVRIRCLGCQRDLTLERVKLEKAIRKVIAGGKGDV